MKTSLLTQKGQVLIPVEFRRKYKLKTGSKVVVTDDGYGIRVTPLTPTSIRNMVGTLKGENYIEALLESRKKDRLTNR